MERTRKPSTCTADGKIDSSVGIAPHTSTKIFACMHDSELSRNKINFEIKTVKNHDHHCLIFGKQ